MHKIKKLWKLLAGSVSWNFKAPEDNAGAVKNGKKEKTKRGFPGNVNEGLTGS